MESVYKFSFNNGKSTEKEGGPVSVMQQSGAESGGVERGHLPPLTLPKIFLFYVSKFYIHILFYFINIF